MAKGTVSISVTDDEGYDITDQFNFVAAGSPPVEPPIEPPIEPIDPPPGETIIIDRPHGLDYMVPGYEAPEVPDDAIRWSDSKLALPAAIDAARSAGKALHLDLAHEFVGDFRSLKLPRGLFGVDGVIIRNTGRIESATPCGLYLVDGDAEIVGIEFVNFGTVFGMSTRSMSVARGYAAPWDIHGSRRSAYGTGRCIDANSDFSGTKVGVPLDYTRYPESLDTTGPGIWISDCTFRNCENVLFEWSDCIGIGPINFHRNLLIGTYGGFAPEGSWWTEVHAVNNQWGGCTAETGREIPSGLKASRFSTFANLGTNATLDVDVSKQVVQILNNEAEKIHCLVNSDGTNAAVFMDARQVTPTEITNPDDPFNGMCSAECSFNRIIDVLGLRGQEDSNAIYGKTRSMLVEGNLVRKCGSFWYADGSATDGAESTGTEFKETGNMSNSPPGAALVLRGNTFEDMPPKDRNTKMQSVMGTNDITLRLWIIGNIFIRDHITNTLGNVPALVRHYGNSPEIRIMCNEYRDCNVVSPASLIGLHSLSGSPGARSEISNNTAHGDYSGNRQMIYSSSGMSGAKVGLNKLIGDGGTYAMTANFGSAEGVIERTYKKRTVEVPAVA